MRQLKYQFKSPETEVAATAMLSRAVGGTPHTAEIIVFHTLCLSTHKIPLIKVVRSIGQQYKTDYAGFKEAKDLVEEFGDNVEVSNSAADFQQDYIDGLKGTIEELHASVSSRDQTIARHDNRILELSEDNDNLLNKCDEFTKNIEALEAVLAQRTNKLHALESYLGIE